MSPVFTRKLKTEEAMGLFHCPLGALAFGDDGCIQCGLCSAVTRAEKIAATQKMRAWIRENRQSSNLCRCGR